MASVGHESNVMKFVSWSHFALKDFLLASVHCHRKKLSLIWMYNQP